MGRKKESKALYVVWGQTINKYDFVENGRRIRQIFEAGNHTGQPCPCKGGC